MATPSINRPSLSAVSFPDRRVAGRRRSDAHDLLHSGWYTTEQVADLIGVDASTLRRWRTTTPLQGPPFVQLSPRVTEYSVPDVERWLRSRRVTPEETS
ncbi:helix-turn-helix transcriptional regulator [Streptacidiphilus carbonis]|uniref:helix-turn-helix transcriptional regulator n=1 Tax=Streptacidiphilus carbonis TaxID=105422 RepID=UPI000AD582DD|nr:helix-turn-helix domain-containing protein [Streptacidiphilus carbonis]